MTLAATEAIPVAERRRGIATLVRAFAEDPVMRWAWEDSDRYATYWPRIAEAYGGRAFDHGTALGLEDCLAVALWLAPGVEPDEATFMKLVVESMDDRLLRDMTGLLEQMTRVHPAREHWYLPLTGADPIAQGRGLGSALLQHGLTTCDRDGLPAYLEATSPRNRSLYERHGFNVIGVIQSGSSPPMWAMLREPVSRPGSSDAGAR
jgi:GNAT superfamily N-acetyltransferase